MNAQNLPKSARDYQRDQRLEISAAVAALERAWRRMGDSFDGSWNAGVGAQVEQILVTGQQRVINRTRRYVPDVLAETGQTRAITAFAETSSVPLLGVAGDGRPVESLSYGAVTRSKQAIALGATVPQALVAGRKFLTLAGSTVLADTSRQQMSLELGTRHVGGYIRMITPPSCSRCLVLAGQWYAANTGFERHPGCLCVHVPASEALSTDLRVDPHAYFETLSAEEQDRVFTKAGAEAIRHGADISQVVNARRGMTRSQSGRLIRNERGLYTTTEGMTRRGWAYQQQRYYRTHGPVQERLMPESIIEIAKNQDDYVRLLRLYGYM